MTATSRTTNRTAMASVVAATLCASAGGSAQAATPPFMLSSPTEPALQAVVGRRADGGFASAWLGFGGAITARRFLADGTPTGTPLVVKPSDGTSTRSIRLAMNRRGDFVISWEQRRADGSDTVVARSYQADGQPAGEVQAAELRNEASTGSDVAIDDDGDFVITWRTVRQVSVPVLLIPYGSVTVGSSSVRARRFTAAGAPIGGTALVAASLTDPAPISGSFEQLPPAVASDGAGNSVVVWSTRDGLGPSAVFARRLGPNGVPRGIAYRVDPRVGDGGYGADVDVTEDGSSTIVTWQQPHSVGPNSSSGFDVRARRYDAADRPGPVIEVGTLVATGRRASVDVNAAGQAVIAWPASASDFCCFPPLVAVQRLDASGALVGGNQVLSTDASENAESAVADDGSAVVIWSVLNLSPPGVLASLLPAP